MVETWTLGMATRLVQPHGWLMMLIHASCVPVAAAAVVAVAVAAAELMPVAGCASGASAELVHCPGEQ